jgi:hypothetical protein
MTLGGKGSEQSEGKANHIEAWRDPEDSSRLRLPDFKKIRTLTLSIPN